MKDVVLATLTGFLIGMLFIRMKLPLPAPPTLAGVMGIVGMFAGYLVAVRLGWNK